jgi:hypothetical protein
MKAEDYRWFTQECRLYPTYCLTLVQGLEVAEALRRIQTETMDRATGLSELIDLAQKNTYWDGRNNGRYYIGATQLDGWTLLVEENGFLGVRPEVIRPLSAGTVVVSHYGGVDGEDEFCWMVDGDLRLNFEPLFPYGRSGSEPDSMVEVMKEVGFDLRRGADRDYSMHTEATMALAEYLTGVRLTAELLDAADYLCGLAPTKR